MDDKPIPRRSGRIWAGLFLLLVGGVLLLDQLGFPLPDWLFSWHILLIAIGLFIGFRSHFRNFAWLILIMIGGAYTIQDYYHNIQLERFILPGVLILVGFAFITGRGQHHRWQRRWHEDWDNKREDWEKNWDKKRWKYGMSGNVATGFSTTREAYSSEDFIDSTSIFGGVHKKIVSKTFKGGDIVTIMGGTEIDLTQADFTGMIRLDVTQIMGGTKIIVPSHWEVRSEVNAIFAGFEDKRQQPAVVNLEKILIIDVTSIFGGIELKNF